MYRKLIWLTPLLLMLNGCSPHPGSGGWRASSADPLFERLEVRFNGNADFYSKTNDETAAWRCFWSAADKRTAELKCIEASSDVEKTYALIVDEDGQSATLEQDGQILGRYIWQAPGKI